jgi:electron transfer flavoprotein beta subunit
MAELVVAPGGAGPLIVACLRYADPWPEVTPLTGEIRRSGYGAGPSRSDLAALETALRIAERWSSRVLAVTAGPPAADEMLRDAIAAGAWALRVDWPALDYPADLAADEQPLAAALAEAIADRLPELVICGDRTPDRGTGALPAFLAHELGAAQALGLVSLGTEEPGTGDGAAGDGAAGDGAAGTGAGQAGLVGERRLPGGRRERVRIPRPAVCSVEAAGLRLRRASLAGTLASRRAAIPVAYPAPHPAARPSRLRLGAPRPYVPRTHDAPPPPIGSARERLLALSGALYRREPPAVIGPLSPDQAADELLAYLRRSAALPGDPA